jgi:hypothetical protein
MLSDLDNEFMEVDRTKGDPKTKFTLLVTSSQIWLIPPVDDHQSSHLTKLGKKNPDTNVNNDICLCMY